MRISRLHWDLGDGRASVGYPSEKKPTLRKSKTMKEAMERQELEDSFEGIPQIFLRIFCIEFVISCELQCGNSTVFFSEKKGHVFFFRCRFFFWLGVFHVSSGVHSKKRDYGGSQTYRGWGQDLMYKKSRPKPAVGWLAQDYYASSNNDYAQMRDLELWKLKSWCYNMGVSRNGCPSPTRPNWSISRRKPLVLYGSGNMEIHSYFIGLNGGIPQRDPAVDTCTSRSIHGWILHEDPWGPFVGVSWYIFFCRNILK